MDGYWEEIEFNSRGIDYYEQSNSVKLSREWKLEVGGSKPVFWGVGLKSLQNVNNVPIYTRTHRGVRRVPKGPLTARPTAVARV